jgi:CRP/FNR family transcriptional regulator, cyclic AMP receptor protein
MLLRSPEKVAMLQSVPLFADCSKRELRKIASIAGQRSVRSGACLIREGGRDREFMVIVDGDVRVSRMGRKVRDLGGGTFVGEIALLCDTPRTATITANTDTTLLVISDRAFRKLMRATPTISEKIMATLAERQAETAL